MPPYDASTMSIVPYRKRTYSQAFQIMPFQRRTLSRQYAGSRRVSYPISYRFPRRMRRFNAFKSGRAFLNDPPGKPELKFLDTDPDLQLDTVGSVVALNAMAQGTSQSTRIGNKITLRSITGRISVGNGSTATSPPVVRYMLIYDTQTNGAAPAITDVLTAVSPVAFMNLANRDRFRVLMDRTFTPRIPYNDTAVTEFQEFQKFYMRINLDTVYNNTNGGTVADIQTGGLFVLALSNAVSGTGEPADGSRWRVRYSDY